MHFLQTAGDKAAQRVVAIDLMTMRAIRQLRHIQMRGVRELGEVAWPIDQRHASPGTGHAGGAHVTSHACPNGVRLQQPLAGRIGRPQLAD